MSSSLTLVFSSSSSKSDLDTFNKLLSNSFLSTSTILKAIVLLISAGFIKGSNSSSKSFVVSSSTTSSSFSSTSSTTSSTSSFSATSSTGVTSSRTTFLTIGAFFLNLSIFLGCPIFLLFLRT